MKINRDKCGICFGCAAVCPFDALRSTDKKILINDNKCTNCGICKKICPVGAITIEN